MQLDPSVDNLFCYLKVGTWNRWQTLPRRALMNACQDDVLMCRQSSIKSPESQVELRSGGIGCHCIPTSQKKRCAKIKIKGW